jgi:transporter family protein
MGNPQGKGKGFAMGVYLLVALSVICWGVSPILEKIALRDLSPLQGVMLRSIFSALAMALVVAFSGGIQGMRELDGKAALLVVIAGLLAGGLGQITYYTALKSDKASLIVPLAASYPMLTVLLSTVLLKESLSLARVAGATLVVIGVVFLRSG